MQDETSKLLKLLINKKDEQTKILQQFSEKFNEFIDYFKTQQKEEIEILTVLINSLESRLNSPTHQQQKPTQAKLSSPQPSKIKPKSTTYYSSKSPPQHVTPSSISPYDFNSFIKKLKIIASKETRQSSDGNISFENFEWGESKEFEKEMDGSILKFFKDNFNPQNHLYKWIGVFNLKNILSADNIGGSGVDVSGGVDFILAKKCVNDDEMTEQILKKHKEDGVVEFSNIVLLVEIKKDLNNIKFQNQSYIEFFSASTFNTNPIIHILTDLKDRWDITYWKDDNNFTTINSNKNFASTFITNFIRIHTEEQQQQNQTVFNDITILNGPSILFNEERKIQIKKNHLNL